MFKNLNTKESVSSPSVSGLKCLLLFPFVQLLDSMGAPSPGFTDPHTGAEYNQPSMNTECTAVPGHATGKAEQDAASLF